MIVTNGKGIMHNQLQVVDEKSITHVVNMVYDTKIAKENFKEQ